MAATLLGLPQVDVDFINTVEQTFAQANQDFARAYYLFATARLEKTYQSAEIYAKYPLLHDEKTFLELKRLYDAHPDNEQIKRLFVESLGSYIGNKLSEASDALTNLKNTLEIDVSGLHLTDSEGKPLERVLYEDTSELFKRIDAKATREALYKRVSEAYTQTVSPKFIDLFHQENALFAELGYPDLITFYSQSSGHSLTQLGEKAKYLVETTQETYTPAMRAFYVERTGASFDQASRADIAYVFHGKSDAMKAIDAAFPEEKLLTLAQKTFDGLGLDFSTLAKPVDFEDKAAYLKTVEDAKRPNRILLDISKREGKRSRAYVYPARAPQEIYLSVKPEGGLDDFSAFFHESGHAQHFAYTHPDLSYSLSLMGNNTVTESYAYLFQNLFLNHHWLVSVAGLSTEQASLAIRRAALNDLYMLRRYASKMQFELALFDGQGLEGKPEAYASLLTHGTGFAYDEDGWSRDVDAGFYVADYFTAWALEAQLRQYLQNHYGSSETQGENWYENPKAGAFLKSLWAQGNLTQAQLSAALGYNDPTDVGPLLTLMQQNLAR